MRKQKEYNEGKFMLRKQEQEKRKQQEELMMQSQMFERNLEQRSKKISIVLEKILVNECKREKRKIEELTQKLKNEQHK